MCLPFWPFWRCAVLVPELLVYWAKVPGCPVCTAGGQEPGNSLTNTLHWAMPGAAPPPITNCRPPPGAGVCFFSFYLCYIMIYTSIYRDSPSLASAGRALIRGGAGRVEGSTLISRAIFGLSR